MAARVPRAFGAALVRAAPQPTTSATALRSFATATTRTSTATSTPSSSPRPRAPEAPRGIRASAPAVVRLTPRIAARWSSSSSSLEGAPPASESKIYNFEDVRVRPPPSYPSARPPPPSFRLLTGAALGALDDTRPLQCLSNPDLGGPPKSCPRSQPLCTTRPPANQLTDLFFSLASRSAPSPRRPRRSRRWSTCASRGSSRRRAASRGR